MFNKISKIKLSLNVFFENNFKLFFTLLNSRD